MYGVELGGTLPFGDFVPALDGFGMTGGVGYTKSQDSHLRGSAAKRPARLFQMGGQRHRLFREMGLLGARGSVRYRSSFQGEVSGFAQNNVFREAKAETIVDGQVGYEFQPGSMLSGLSIYVQGLNLTNEPFVTTNPGQTIR